MDHETEIANHDKVGKEHNAAPPNEAGLPGFVGFDAFITGFKQFNTVEYVRIFGHWYNYDIYENFA